MQQSATDHSTGNFPNGPDSLAIFPGKHIILSSPLIFFSNPGTIDMDLITTGVSASERMRRESLIQATRNIIMEKMQIGGPSMRLVEVS